MVKKVAILVVNPVNGAGLFQYLEALLKNGIPYKTFAVVETTSVKTNLGMNLQTDDKIANLKGYENEYDALIFACGKAMKKFNDNVNKPFNQDLLAVTKNFANNSKILAGHCSAALLFDNFVAVKNKYVALNPLVKTVTKNCIRTDREFVVDDNIYTAQTEKSISLLLPELLTALK